ncbi:WhiB transcriptional factor [Mycobacterium phage Lolly9]|uniref:WhiB family transcription factor n=1 Tax=Mycobacterium phage Lolly9 TaxID=1698711 RepID=A0A0K2FN11_9CAUD|nr:WhiB transcriptional factor [Mycobacterium phage Lolly9]ALA48496.1 WhiB family transcription factor [Mycobacterium phage Lolly9]QOP65808.1 WhiB family transcription factor [Mycobacterium phage MiniLon]QOP66555.1 WhiB family transcription factor [Mycobacterium phage MiniMac]
MTIEALHLSGARTRQIPEMDIPDLPGALCKGHEDPDLWHPGPGAGGRNRRDQAVAICKQCPVQMACLQYALEWDRDHTFLDRVQGVWGGVPEPERRKLLKGNKGAA